MAHKQSQFVYTNKFMTMAAYGAFSKPFNKQNIFLMGLKNRKFFVIQCMVLGTKEINFTFQHFQKNM